MEDDKTDSESSSDVGISLSLDCDSLWLLLPMQLRDAFGSERIPDANILSNFFADRADLESFASVHCPSDAGVSISHTCSILSTLVARASEQACRVHKRRALVPDSAQLLAVSLASGVKRLRTDVVPEFARAWLRKRSGPITVRRWRHRLDRRLASTSCTSSRQEMERQELQHWQIVLADLVKEAGLPVVEHMKLVRFPESMLLAALGSARAATIRKHVREWKKVKLYCLATSGKAWPQHVGLLLDYLHERYLEPCARTVPQAILASWRKLEELLLMSVFLRCLFCATLTADLEAKAPPKRKAPVLPVSVIGAIELAIGDTSLPLYVRAFAFYKLVKFWTASRSGDMAGLCPSWPSSLRLTAHGLVGTLDRTKTSGPGKRVRFLPSRHLFFIKPH